MTYKKIIYQFHSLYICMSQRRTHRNVRVRVVSVCTRMYTHASAKQKNVDLHIFPAHYTHTCKYVCTCAFTSVFVSACYVYISFEYIYTYIPGTIYTHHAYIHKMIYMISFIYTHTHIYVYIYT